MPIIDDNIDKLFDFANSALSSARSTSGRISTFVPNIPSSSLKYTAPTPAIEKPASLSDLLSPDNSSATLAFLDAESDKWLAKYFPEIDSCANSSAEEWSCGILTGQKPYGLSPDVFEAVWHEGRDREYRSRNSATAQIRADFSARGFSLPPGAMIKAVIRAEESASDAIAEINRAQMVRNAEIKLDLQKYAADISVRLRLGMLQSMADFYRQWVDLPNKDLEASRIRTQAYSSFQSAMSIYWNVQLGFEELRLQAENLRMNGKLDETRMRVSASTADTRNAALGQATRAYGDVASASSSAASTLVADLSGGA